MSKNRTAINKNRALSLWKRRILWKSKKKQSRRLFLKAYLFYTAIASNQNNAFRVFKSVYKAYNVDHKDYVKITAPNSFSFVDNTEEVIEFINQLSHCFDNKKKVFVVLRKVKSVSYDAIVVLLSIMVKFKSHNIDFNGDLPINRAVSDTIKASGFFDYLGQKFNEEKRYTLGQNQLGNRIHTHAFKDVDAELGKNIISDASLTIWGKKCRCQGIQRTFLELMQNTNNHAGERGEKHWWLSVYHVPHEKKVCFSFVDFGVGVFKSLENKPPASIFYRWKEKLRTMFTMNNNADILSHILQGNLHRTVTGEHYRGKGIPCIKAALDRNQLSNLHIITNDVRGDVKNDSYSILTNHFSGTFVYWELRSNNQHCDGNA